MNILALILVLCSTSVYSKLVNGPDGLYKFAHPPALYNEASLKRVYFLYPAPANGLKTKSAKLFSPPITNSNVAPKIQTVAPKPATEVMGFRSEMAVSKDSQDKRGASPVSVYEVSRTDAHSPLKVKQTSTVVSLPSKVLTTNPSSLPVLIKKFGVVDATKPVPKESLPAEVFEIEDIVAPVSIYEVSKSSELPRPVAINGRGLKPDQGIADLQPVKIMELGTVNGASDIADSDQNEEISLPVSIYEVSGATKYLGPLVKINANEIFASSEDKASDSEPNVPVHGSVKVMRLDLESSAIKSSFPSVEVPKNDLPLSNFIGSAASQKPSGLKSMSSVVVSVLANRRKSEETLAEPSESGKVSAIKTVYKCPVITPKAVQQTLSSTSAVKTNVDAGLSTSSIPSSPEVVSVDGPSIVTYSLDPSRNLAPTISKPLVKISNVEPVLKSGPSIVTYPLGTTSTTTVSAVPNPLNVAPVQESLLVEPESLALPMSSYGVSTSNAKQFEIGSKPFATSEPVVLSAARESSRPLSTYVVGQTPVPLIEGIPQTVQTSVPEGAVNVYTVSSSVSETAPVEIPEMDKEKAGGANVVLKLLPQYNTKGFGGYFYSALANLPKNFNGVEIKSASSATAKGTSKFLYIPQYTKSIPNYSL